ncbi:MAG: hypothetical protein JW807_15520 [Spirochaetes bacterium]|nr:hypothetical protein [Spirochaetota bacterium]
MNIKTYIPVVAAALFLLAPLASTGAGRAVDPVKSDSVLAEVYARSIELYKKYRGVESLRRETTKEYDPATNALRSTSEIVLRRKEYFYAKPEIEVLSYKKDGVEMKPSQLRTWKSLPAYPVFDEKGRERYEVKISGTKRIRGTACYRVEVTPRKETSRHFRGEIYIAVGSLETVCIKGTMAKLDFPLRDIWMEIYTTLLGEVPVAESGTVRVRVNIPVFFPDTIIETSFTVTENRLIR